jgi:rhodanese-related sulfurtransferase
MSRTYLILTVIALIGAAVLIFLPDKTKNNELDPERLLMEINNPSRFLSVDRVAHRLVEKDPSLLLIDVRAEEAYNDFSLPGAVNIPVSKVLLSENEDFLNRSDLEVVLFSNEDIYADQAWILCTRIGYKNLYVMRGGLNEWFDKIMQPEPPAATAPNEAFDLYSFRLAASQYFGGGTMESTEQPKETIIIKRREKKSATAGGC